MRYLFLTPRFPPEIGGLASSADRIARAIAALGHEVHVLALSGQLPEGQGEMILADNRLVVHRLGLAVDAMALHELLAEQVRWLHRRHRFDALWGHSLYRVGFPAICLARELGLTSLLALRGDDFDDLFHPPGDFGRLDWCLRHAGRVLAVSRDLQARAQAVAGRPIEYLPNYVDCSVFRPGPPPVDLVLRHGLDAGPIVLGFCGELRQSKGMAALLDAFQQVWNRQAARLLILGEVAPEDRGEFQRRTQSPAPLAGDILRTGHLGPREVARHLRLCRLLMLPSRVEGMPNALLEAMACGVPVVASAVGGIPDVIRDGVNGFLVPRGRPDLLSRQVMAALEMAPEALLAVGQAGRTTVESQFDRAQELQRLGAVLSGL